MPISLSLRWRAPWNITNWIFHDVSLPNHLCYKVKDLTTGFCKGAFLHSLLPSQFQHIERFSKCLKRREIIFQNITNGLGTNCMSSSKKKKLWKLLSIIKSGSREEMLYNTYWPAGRVGRCYPQTTVSPIIGRGKRHARNRGKRRWNLKDSLRLTHYFRLMFLHEAAGMAEPAPGSWGAGSLIPRLWSETTSGGTTIPMQPSCQACSYPSTQTRGLLPLRREVLLWPRSGTEPGWRKKPTKILAGKSPRGTSRWVNVTKRVTLRDHLGPALASQKS